MKTLKSSKEIYKLGFAEGDSWFSHWFIHHLDHLGSLEISLIFGRLKQIHTSNIWAQR